MRSKVILLLALLVTGAFAASAQAAKPAKVKEVEKSSSAIKDYWTAERMENAIPLDLTQAAPGDKQRRAAIPFTRYEPNPYPPMHGKVFFSDGVFNYVCSGTALTSGNESTVWTAGHCVHSGPGAFYMNWAFVPAYKDNARPYGTWTARRLFTTSAWATTGDFSYDLGAAVMNTNAGATLTDTVGGRGVAFNQAAQQRYLSHGYPAASPFNGQRQWICDSNLGHRDNSANPPTMAIGCDMTGGSSGGGWLVGNNILSVNSYGYSNEPNVMYGPYQGTVAQQLYTSASSG
jgi:V8-like Glu-specific endopeptidase